MLGFWASAPHNYLRHIRHQMWRTTYDAPTGHVRFDERGVETERMTGYSGTDNRKGRKPLRPSLIVTAPLLDSTITVDKQVAARRRNGQRGTTLPGGGYTPRRGNFTNPQQYISARSIRLLVRRCCTRANGRPCICGAVR